MNNKPLHLQSSRTMLPLLYAVFFVFAAFAVLVAMLVVILASIVVIPIVYSWCLGLSTEYLPQRWRTASTPWYITTLIHLGALVTSIVVDVLVIGLVTYAIEGLQRRV